MVLNQGTDCKSIIVESDLLDSFIGNESFYEKIVIIVKVNCETVYQKEYDSTNPITTTGDITSVSGVHSINASLFNDTVVKDGIYGVQIKLYPLVNQATSDAGCIFVNCNTTCKVCTNDFNNLMLFYILNVTQKCDCYCETLCDVYKLLKLTDDSKSEKGCSNC